MKQNKVISSFTVDPDVFRAAVEKAKKENISLSFLIQSCLEKFLSGEVVYSKAFISFVQK